MTPPRNITINFGPQHPSAHGVLRLVLELDGEIVSASTRIAACRTAAPRSSSSTRPICRRSRLRLARLCLADNQEQRSASRREELGSRRRAARNRSARSIPEIGPPAFAHPQRDDASAGRRRAHPAAVGLRRARKAHDVLRARLGIAHACRYFRVGRRAPGPAAETDRRHRSILRPVPARVCDDLEGLLTENRIFKQRNVDIGVVGLTDAWAPGFPGDGGGAGAAWDLRKSQPYECYAEIDFDIPVGKNADCYDRYCVRHGRHASAACSSSRHRRRARDVAAPDPRD